jgi:signal transduction histidine kinase/CheY-like chemotaxis protein/HAMP domain-containing protein
MRAISPAKNTFATAQPTGYVRGAGGLFDAMKQLSSLRVRLVGIVLLAVAPALALLVYFKQTSLWLDFTMGFFALTAAWIGGELFVLRQVNSIMKTARRLAAGDWSSRTGLRDEATELGELADSLDAMAARLERQNQERETSEKSLLDRAHQQTVIAALGQFAVQNSGLGVLLSQTVMLVAQTLETEYCQVLELLPGGKVFRLRVGVGWKEGSIGRAEIDAGANSQAGYTLVSGEPVVVEDLQAETRFQAAPYLAEHGVVSGATVSIQGHEQPFGVLGVHTTRPRAFSEDEVHFLLAVSNLIALAVERDRTEPEIQKLAAFAKFNPNAVLEFSADGSVLFFNEAAQKMAAKLGQSHPGAVLPPEARDIVQTCLATGQNRLSVETRPGGRILSWSFYPILASQSVHGYVEDTTERSSLEDQLRQAQKMESVGQLAAGVAHDFNNILTIIQGHSGLLMSRPNLTPAMTTSIQAVSFAAERAASLTRQLLMFSRKQVMQPKSLDLKDVVANMSKMLQRLIGETIKLKCELPEQLPSIRGDTGMMEQVLMNLAVNARDAMPRGGELTITTGAVAVGEDYVRLHPEARAGDFVSLQVSDTGTGMEAATMKRIFEPFFTTKEAGKGTGLGLATVYGIVKQHAGWIDVQSEVGRGTTFQIFFPADNRPRQEQTEILQPAQQLRGNGELILVVEDEPVLRDLAQLILQDCGYRVLQAASGVEALEVWQKHHGSIDLLLTDMVMPDGLSGKDLAESLVGDKPELKVIFTSGYNVDDLGADLVKQIGSQFLQKPYSRFTLARAVRDCLNS